MATIIQIRKGTLAEWTSSNPVLAEGEIGIEIETPHSSSAPWKVGDGTTAYLSLPYQTGGGGAVDSVFGRTGAVVAQQDDYAHDQLSGLGDDDHTQYSLISTGAGAPGSTPTREGLIYVDTTGDSVYVSTGTASSADWTRVSGVDAHNLYGPAHSDVDTGTALATRHILGWDGTDSFDPSYRTEFLDFVEGQTYYPQQQTYKAGWVSTAKVETQQYPVPVATGDPVEQPDRDNAGWVDGSASANTVLSGVEVDVVDAGYLEEVWAYLPDAGVDVYYRVLGKITLDSDPDNPRDVVSDYFQADAIGWAQIDIDTILLAAGTTVEILLQYEDRSSVQNFVGAWNYTSSNQAEVPASGEAHRRTNRQFVTFNATDNGGVDHGSGGNNDFANLKVGDRIVTAVSDWIITAINLSGPTLYEFDVSGSGNPSNGLHVFDFIYTGIATQKWYELPGFWAAEPGIKGILKQDGVSVGVDNNAYSISVVAQEATLPTDWVFYPVGTATSGGGTATSPLTTKGDIWGYDTGDARIPVGATDGHVLKVNSAQPLGVEWAAESGGGATKIVDPLWDFDTTTTMADPGSGAVRFNDAVFGNVGQIAISDYTNQNNGTQTINLLDYLNPGAYLFFKQADDPTREVIFRVTGVTQQIAAQNWSLVDVDFISNGPLNAFENGAEVGGARVVRDIYIQQSEIYTVGTLGGEDFGTLDAASAFLSRRPYSTTAPDSASGKNHGSYTLELSAQTHVIGNPPLTFRAFSASVDIRGVGATVQGDILVQSCAAVNIFDIALEGTLDVVDSRVAIQSTFDGTNTRLYSRDGGSIFLAQPGATVPYLSIRSNTSGRIQHSFTNSIVTVGEYVASEGGGIVAANVFVVNAAALYNNAAVYASSGSQITTRSTISVYGGDGGVDPALYAVYAETGAKIIGGDIVNNSTFANFTNIIPGEITGDGTVISDSSTPSSVENSKNYFDSYKDPDEPIVLLAYGDSNMQGGQQFAPEDFLTVDNPNIYVWQPNDLPTKDFTTASWKQVGVDFSTDDPYVQDLTGPVFLGMILGQPNSDPPGSPQNAGNIGYFLADQIQKRSGRKVYLYEISAPGTNTGYWLTGQNGHTEITNGTYGLAAALALVPDYSRTNVDVRFNCNATNDSFLADSTGLFQVDAETFVNNVKQFVVDVPAGNGRQSFHSEAATIDDGEGPTIATGKYYPFAWHGLDYLDGETNDTDKVVSSWGITTNGPTDVHFNGDGLNIFGLVAADSAIVGPIPKRHLRRQTFVDRFQPVIENTMDCQENGMNQMSEILSSFDYEVGSSAPDPLGFPFLTKGGTVQCYDNAGFGAAAPQIVLYNSTLQFKAAPSLFGVGQTFVQQVLIDIDDNINEVTSPAPFANITEVNLASTANTNAVSTPSTGGYLRIPVTVLDQPVWRVSGTRPLTVSNTAFASKPTYDNVTVTRRIGYDHDTPNLQNGATVATDLVMRWNSGSQPAAISAAAAIADVGSGDVIPAGRYLMYQSDGNAGAGISLISGIQMRQFASRLVRFDVDGNITEESAVNTNWLDKLAEPFDVINVQTVSNSWQVAHTIATTNGHEETGLLQIKAKRTTVGSNRRYMVRYATMTANDGTLVVYSEPNNPPLGNQAVDSEIIANGSDIEIRVAGLANETWDWEITYFHRAF